MSTTTYIILGVIALLLIFLLASYNGLVSEKNRVKEAFATMDVYLKKRWDLIPNLVETVKGYAKHEKETLAEVIKLRNSTYERMSSDEKLNANKELSAGISKIMALAESYPDLKANTNFINLSDQLGTVENDIANSRKYYNAVVRDYNNKVQMFPSNIVARLFGYREESMFETAAAERENVKIKF